MKKIKVSFIWLAIILYVGVGIAQQNIDLNTPMPINPKVKIGKLPNGIVYYIQKNQKPENRVEMRLIVNAGSILETDEQQGLAHFVEHMAFNGTKHFAKNELVDFFEKAGMRFGSGLNAYTAYDETVYMLQLPTDKQDIYEKGFQVLEDWAFNLTLSNEEIDKERGVIIEEWRRGLSANDRMYRKSYPIVLKGSLYAERSPIGKPEIIENFKYETLRNYYSTWYRPDLMAIAVVGDIDVNFVEEKIKVHFSTAKNPTNPQERKLYDIPDNTDPLISIQTDPEATQNTIQISIKHPAVSNKTIGDYRQFLIRSLYNSMINSRINEITQKPDAPFVYAYSYYGGFLSRGKDGYNIVAIAKENKIEEAMKTVLLENYRVKQFGYTQTELEREKQNLLVSYEQMAKEADKTQSRKIISEYVANYLKGEAIPGIENELQYVKMFLPTITLNEVNELAGKWLTDNNMIVMIHAPQKEGLNVPTVEKVQAIISQAKQEKLSPYTDKVSDAPLFNEKLKGSKVKTKKYIPEIEATEITLTTGQKIILKPTNFKNDQILFDCYSFGGSSLYPDNKSLTADFTSSIIAESGISKFDKIELEKKLAGKIVSIYPSIEELDEGLSGECAPKDFETLLQLMYLYFTQPRKDSLIFTSFMSRVQNQVKFSMSNPNVAFRDTLTKVCTKHNPRLVTIPTEEQLASIKLNDVMSIYKERFADASDFVFVFVGNFKIDSIIPLLEKYIGSLPSLKRNETFKNVTPEFPAGITKFQYRKGIEPQSMIVIKMKNDFKWDFAERINFTAMMRVLEIKMRQAVREDKSGTYAPSVYPSITKFPTPKCEVTISFGCNPTRVDELTQTVFEVIDSLQKYGPSIEDLDKVKEMMIRERETGLKENSFWISRLKYLYYYQDELSSITKYTDYIKAITPQSIQKSALTYITPNHYVLGVLMPGKTE